MDYEKFDNDADSSTDAEYFAFVEWLRTRTAAELDAAGTDVEMQKKALCRYYWRGYRSNLTPGELIDFLGVSSPSILDRAGYSEAESGAVMKLSDCLTQDDINAFGREAPDLSQLRLFETL